VTGPDPADPHADAHAALPLDPDAASTGAASTGRGARPAHLQPRLLLVVFAGGVLGTPARYAVSLALPTGAGGWPTGTLVVNLLGALLLGALLEGLSRRGADGGRRRLLRLGLGTGFLGAFTTYSALAVESDLLVRAGRPGLAAAYALVTALAGLLLSAAGIQAAAAHHRHQHRHRHRDRQQHREAGP